MGLLKAAYRVAHILLLVILVLLILILFLPMTLILLRIWLLLGILLEGGLVRGILANWIDFLPGLGLGHVLLIND